MNCVFFGTPEFARRVLESITSRHRVLLAVTQPDRPAGRGRKTMPPPVKEFCREAGIPCLQPDSARDPALREAVRSSGAQVGIVVSYGGYLPAALLGALPHGFINLHPSLLPRYRGAAPGNWALIRGEREIGITAMRVTGRMDAGPILRQERLAILPGETAGELLERLADPGAALLLYVLRDLEKGVLRETEQDEAAATYAPRLRKEDGLIDWSRTAAEIHDLVRGVNPWPGAQTYHGRNLIKIWQVSPVDQGGRPGEILSADAQRGLAVAAGTGALLIRLLQKEGGQPLPPAAFLRGARWRVGDLLTPARAPGIAPAVPPAETVP